MSRKSKTENAAKLINIINTLIERQEKLLDYVQYLEDYCAALEGTEIDNTLVGQEIEDEVMKENHYFLIPELEYMMSVPEVKKTVWEEWKQKRRTFKNDLFL